MKRIVRKTRVVFKNPAYVKPAEEITDRAKRYRAHHPDVEPAAPKRCGFCGSGRNVIPHHINGNEAHTTRENLMWACKSCNGKVASRMKKAGLGKPTNQYNPSKRGRATPGLKEYGAAIKVMRGQFDGDVAAAMRTIHATPPHVRSAYTARSWPVRKAVYGPSGRQGRFTFDDVPF